MWKFSCVILSGLLLMSCEKKQDSQTRSSHFQQNEESPQYQQALKRYLFDYAKKKSPLVDTIKIEGNRLYVKFSRPEAGFNYSAFARSAALEFNQFKQKQLGFTGVSVYCIHDSGTVAHAIVR
ncbi:MAG: hypothetical protein A2293_10955 [Elusimicrobia bacterium RIFOXYB2_FULL_49_7]|nr:MAG: hypothetical protein A2293_10955 [Elusimicrobia bacterium RIFOXYB2_FULL_49_7]